MITTLFALAVGATGLNPIVGLILAVMVLFLLFSKRILPFAMTFLTTDDAIKYLISIGFLDSAGGLKFAIQAKTADYTIVTGTDRSGTIFTNRGASAAVIFTLPAPAQGIAGAYYDFISVADQDVTVKTATADTLIVVNDLTADSLKMGTSNQKIGSAMRAVCDGTSWIAFGYAIGAGGDTGCNTYTVAT